MILTVFRHGQAGHASTDRQRNLTSQGISDVERATAIFCKACSARDIPLPDILLHSPWVRTTQTATILYSGLPRAAMRAEQALYPGSRVSDVERLLGELFESPASPSGHLMLVSHQPLVSDLADHLLGVPHGVPPLSPGGWYTLSMEYAAFACSELIFRALPPEYEVSR